METRRQGRPLEADPDATAELGPADEEASADEALKGSRLLLVRQAIEAVDFDGNPGGAVQLACTFQFQPAENCRFASARLVLKLRHSGWGSVCRYPAGGGARG